MNPGQKTNTDPIHTDDKPYFLRLLCWCEILHFYDQKQAVNILGYSLGKGVVHEPQRVAPSCVTHLPPILCEERQ